MAVCIPIKEMKNTAEFTNTVLNAGEPVMVTKNGREALVSMAPEIYEGLCMEAARAQLYDLVDKGITEAREGRTIDARQLSSALHEQYGF